MNTASSIALIREVTVLPQQLGELLAKAGLRDVQAWWKELDLVSRRQVFQLWEDCVAANEGQQVIACVEGDFLGDEGMDGGGFWHQELYNYLVNHELHFHNENHRHFFHACTRHPLAKAAIQAGKIPASFTCGLGEKECPLRRIMAIAPGKTMRLKLTFRAAETA